MLAHLHLTVSLVCEMPIALSMVECLKDGR